MNAKATAARPRATAPKEPAMRTAQELAAMTYDDVKTAWHRFEISQVEKDAWLLANGDKVRRGYRLHPEAIRLRDEMQALAEAAIDSTDGAGTCDHGGTQHEQAQHCVDVPCPGCDSLC